MHRISTRTFFIHLAVLLLAACFVIFSVLCNAVSSAGLEFAEYAARTDAVLTGLSCLLLLTIFAFSFYILYRRHRAKRA